MEITVAMNLDTGTGNLKSDVFAAELSDMRLQKVLSNATKDWRAGKATTEQAQGSCARQTDCSWYS